MREINVAVALRKLSSSSDYKEYSKTLVLHKDKKILYYHNKYSTSTSFVTKYESKMEKISIFFSSDCQHKFTHIPTQHLNSLCTYYCIYFDIESKVSRLPQAEIAQKA